MSPDLVRIGWRSSALLSILGFSIAGAAWLAFAESPPNFPRISSLWPMAVKEYLSRDRVYTHVASPIFSQVYRPDESRRTFRPIATAVNTASDSTLTVDFLPPIGRVVRSESDRSFHLFPLIAHRSWTSGDGSNHVFSTVFPIYHKKIDGHQRHSALFPFYMSGTAGSVSYPIPFKSTRPYSAVFPLYGNLYGAFGNDRLTFAFWPIYTRIEKTYTVAQSSADTPTPFVKHQFFWPFITVGSGGGYKSFKIWPLFGQTRKEGHYLSRFVAWPIFNVTKNLSLDPAKTRDIVAGLPVYWDIQEGQRYTRSVFPFYGRRVTPDLDRSFKIWPLYIYSKYIKEDYTRRDYLWPIFSRTKGSETGFKVWPLFGVRNRREVRNEKTITERSAFYFWTLGKYEKVTGPDNWRSYHRLFPLFAFGRYDDRQGYRQRQVFLWPLVSYQEDRLRQTRAVSFPNVLGSFEAHFPAIQEVYGPIWRVVDYTRQGEESRLSVLWNLVDIRKDSGGMAMSVGPLIKFQQTPAGAREYTLLSALRLKTVPPAAASEAVMPSRPTGWMSVRK